MAVSSIPLNSTTSSQTLNIFVAKHDSATDFLDASESHLSRREREANTILPLAQAYRAFEVGNGLAPRRVKALWEQVKALRQPEVRDAVEETERLSAATQFWLTLWSAGSPPVLDLALSCTSSHIDNLPIFIWSSRETSTLSSDFLAPRMALLTTHLLDTVSPKRVFSCFAPNAIIEAFAREWSARTGMTTCPRPYYSAALTYVNLDTITSADPSRTSSLPPYRFVLRKASRADIPAVAEHCFEFAADSDFPIDHNGAHLEASHYINHGQMWVCAVETPNGMEIGCVVAVTRNTLRNATITKVHTAPAHRKRGYAESLVRHVCESILFDDVNRPNAIHDTAPYDAVALYVAHDNIAAAIVYDRVGFQGLLGKPRPAGVEDVLELGFENAIKGYW